MYHQVPSKNCVMKYQVVTYADVESTARKLIEKNGETTTLDVKNNLRDQGFFAVQSDISRFMDQVANSVSEIEWNDTGGHRIYYGTFDTGSETHEVWHKGDPSSKWTFQGVKNRNAARNAYATMFDVPYRDTRSQKL